MKWRGATRQVFLKQISSVDFWTSSAQLPCTPSKANESNFKNLTLCKWSTIKVPEFRDNTTKKNLEKILDHTHCFKYRPVSYTHLTLPTIYSV